MIFVEGKNANAGKILVSKIKSIDAEYFESLGLYRKHGMYGLSAR